MKKNILSDSEEFFTAVEKGDVKKAAALLEAGIDPNLQDQAGWTALHWASYGGHLEVVKYLLEKGANVNFKDANNKTILCYQINKND